MTCIHESLLLTCVRTIEVFDHVPIFTWANCNAIAVDLGNILVIGVGQEPVHFVVQPIERELARQSDDDETKGEILSLVGFLFSGPSACFLLSFNKLQERRVASTRGCENRSTPRFENPSSSLSSTNFNLLRFIDPLTISTGENWFQSDFPRGY